MIHYIYDPQTKELFVFSNYYRKFQLAGKLSINQRINLGSIDLLKSSKYLHLLNIL